MLMMIPHMKGRFHRKHLNQKYVPWVYRGGRNKESGRPACSGHTQKLIQDFPQCLSITFLKSRVLQSIWQLATISLQNTNMRNSYFGVKFLCFFFIYRYYYYIFLKILEILFFFFVPFFFFFFFLYFFFLMSSCAFFGLKFGPTIWKTISFIWSMHFIGNLVEKAVCASCAATFTNKNIYHLNMLSRLVLV